ncbi:hypothetical protein [uncultured Zhongshania sp.]|uniref:hypothetical protein n=1 Tax=uncultured Zhongshania sp. TaxID=1642288 RepID=UPI0030D75F73
MSSIYGDVWRVADGKLVPCPFEMVDSFFDDNYQSDAEIIGLDASTRVVTHKKENLAGNDDLPEWLFDVVVNETSFFLAANNFAEYLAVEAFLAPVYAKISAAATADLLDQIIETQTARR